MKHVKYIIKDWASNVMDHNGFFRLPQLAVAKEFKTFDDAWDYIIDNIPDDTHEDVSVEKVLL